MLLVQRVCDVATSLPLHSPYCHLEGHGGSKPSTSMMSQIMWIQCMSIYYNGGNCTANGKSLYGLESLTAYMNPRWPIHFCQQCFLAKSIDRGTAEISNVTTSCAVEVYGFDPRCYQALFPLWTKVGREIGTGYEINWHPAFSCHSGGTQLLMWLRDTLLSRLQTTTCTGHRMITSCTQQHVAYHKTEHA